MCVAQKSGPGREYSVAVDWRDCAWSPRIVVQSRWGEAPDEPSLLRPDVPQPVREDQPSPGFRLRPAPTGQAGATGARPDQTAKRETKQSPTSTLFYLNP
jgi:hypothetical protein